MRVYRGYSTWEEDFLSERCELRGFEDELVAVVDLDDSGGMPANSFYVQNAAGTRILTGMQKGHAMTAAEALLSPRVPGSLAGEGL